MIQMLEVVVKGRYRTIDVDVLSKSDTQYVKSNLVSLEKSMFKSHNSKCVGMLASGTANVKSEMLFSCRE